MDRLHSMRVFARVIDQGSFASAARDLNLSAAVVTRLVADLEEHLGARLINRTTRRLALTDIGELYLERVRQILTEIEDAETIATAATAEPRGHLRVLCPPAFSAHQLVKHLPRFRAQFPNITLEILVHGPAEVVGDNADVTILTEGRRARQSGFVTRRLARSEVIVCASPAYLERAGRPRHPRELIKHETFLQSLGREITFHAGNSFERRAAVDALPGASYTLTPAQPALSTAHTDTIYAAALAGMGITGLPSFMVESAIQAKALERVMPQWHLLASTFYAAVSPRKHVPARTRVFIDFLVKAFGGEDRDPWLLALGCETQPPDPAESPQAALEFGR